MIRALVMDTSILCVWLRVPGMDSCGPRNDRWDYNRVDQKIEDEIQAGATLVLPLASIIETGNHISQAKNKRRFNCAQALAEIITKVADETSPWAAFSDQSVLWNSDKLKELAESWPNLAVQGISLGDATIRDVADYYAQPGWEVEILTGDMGLQSLAPHTISAPRRRR